MQKTFGLILCGLIVGVTLLPINLRAYVLNGSWKTTDVGFYVNPSNKDMPAADAITAIQQASFAWSSQSNATFTFSYLGTTAGTTVGNNGRNEVMFRDATNGSAAATTYTYYSNGKIVDADVVIWDAGFTFFPGSDGCSGGVYLQDIATHEFGHVAGIAHSPVTDATMYPTIGWCSQSMRSLATDDQEAIEALYPSGGTNSPPSVSILAPANNSTFDGGTLVALSGSASDPQDGDLSTTINWRSSIDGALGTGGALSVVLSPGTHTITAAVTDAAGAATSASETVLITQVAQSTTPSLLLTGTGYKVKGLQKVDLRWSGATSISVDIYRDGVWLATSANDGAETDAINRKGSGTYRYKVCEAGTSTCSADVLVVF